MACGAIYWLVKPLPQEQLNVEWEKLGDDLEKATVIKNSWGIFSTTITFIRTSLKRYRPGVIHARDFGLQSSQVKDLARTAGATVAINANFFDERGKPLGLVVSRGRKHSSIHRGGKTINGLFISRRTDNAILNRKELKDQSVVEAIQAGPLLLENGVPTRVKGADRSTNRSGLCLDNNGRLILFVVSAEFRGMALDQLQSLLLNPLINCSSALNLDGGGSSQLYVSSSISGAPANSEPVAISGRDNVPVALALFPKKPGHIAPN